MSIQYELSAELKKLSRELVSVQEEIKGIHATEPAHFVKISELEARVDSIKQERVELGRRLLELDRETKKRAELRATEAASLRDGKLEPFLKKLEAWTKRTKALEKLGKDYEELVILSKELERLNIAAQKNGNGRAIGVVFSGKLKDRLRLSLISSFGMEIMSNIHPVRNACTRGSYDLVKETGIAISAARDSGKESGNASHQ